MESKKVIFFSENPNDEYYKFSPKFKKLFIGPKDYRFYSSDQLFNALRANHFNDDKTVQQIIENPDSNSEFVIQNFNQQVWDIVKYRALVLANLYKFQDVELQNLLLLTGDSDLVYCDESDTNLLGKALEEIRTTLRLQYTFPDY